MFGPPGYAYVYLISGLHCMLIGVAAGDGAGLLLRAADPLDGWASDLTGPGRLAKGFGVTLEDNGLDLTTDDFRFWSAATIGRRSSVAHASASTMRSNGLAGCCDSLTRRVLPPPSFFSALSDPLTLVGIECRIFCRLHRHIIQRPDNYHAVARRCMPAVSAGILLYVDSHELSVLLAHPGGPYFRRKDLSAWTIPKGLVNNNEDLESAA